ncbi:hypothetical protein SAMN04488570_1089 [Nocardioides scoriae]|uniref:Uncharacterized protein n=1 Tax=Nocardioides scoriae TaxID=642780 RepID=A0A1H1PB31_9ACTN|nr:hypothetical protein [Nocardioides scoriae]SDS08290.1 hypothetical protein SAMN04488570_1089 [Nocardioides scoriae]
MSAATVENPYAGQGAVLLDIGGDVGAVVVEVPDEMEGVEVEIRPAGAPGGGHHHAHDHGTHTHHPHVAVVRRPVADGLVASLVFGEVVEGSYVLVVKDTDDVQLRVEVRGGEVTQTSWPR